MENESIEYDQSSRSANESEPAHSPESYTLSLPEPEEYFPEYKENSLLDSASREAVNSHQVAYEMAVTSALGVISAACQGLVDVAFPNGFTVPTSLMTLTIAESGERKTTLDKHFSGSLGDIQEEKGKQYEEQYRKYQRDLKNWKLKEKALNKRLLKCHEEGRDSSEIEQLLHALDAEQPRPPRAYKLIYSDTTPSALAFGMHQNIPIALLQSDEAGSLMTGRALSDLYLLNSMWSGSDTAVERRTSESFVLRNARLSVSLMVQPGTLKRFMQKKGDEAHDSGFLARMLLSYPERKIGKRTRLSPLDGQEYIEKFRKRVRELIEMSLEVIESKRERKALRFSSKASEVWNELYAIVEREANADRVYAHAHAHSSKLMDNVSRVAALVHTFENENFDKPISSDDLTYAFKICRHYSGHFMRHIAGQPRVVKLADLLVRSIRRYTKELPNPDLRVFTRSDITQRANPVFKEHDDFNGAIELLKRLGHLEVYKERGKTHYQFSETLLKPSSEPELKNGELYYVQELPKFEAQTSHGSSIGGPHNRRYTKHEASS
jgi:hypothetical protein